MRPSLSFLLVLSGLLRQQHVLSHGTASHCRRIFHSGCARSSQRRPLAFTSSTSFILPLSSATKSRKLATSSVLWGRRGKGRGDAGGLKNKKGKTVAKGDLPSKICVVCGRPFTWRKKWERCWDEVTCCTYHLPFAAF